LESEDNLGGATVNVQMKCDAAGCEQTRKIAVPLRSLKAGSVVKNHPGSDGWYESATGEATYCPLHKPKVMPFLKIGQIG
jgi:hypothetical protein